MSRETFRKRKKLRKNNEAKNENVWKVHRITRESIKLHLIVSDQSWDKVFWWSFFIKFTRFNFNDLDFKILYKYRPHLIPQVFWKLKETIIYIYIYKINYSSKWIKILCNFLIEPRISTWSDVKGTGREMYEQVEQKRENERIKCAEGATMELARSAVIESWLSIQWARK